VAKSESFSPARAGSIDAAEIHRTIGRRIVAPLIAAGLILTAEAALCRGPQRDRDVQPRAAPEPVIEVPAFVRPPKPPPDVLIGGRIRIG